MAHTLLERICLKSLNKIKNYPFPYSHLKKIKKFQNFFLFVTIFFKRKLSYLITRSGKFGNLVTRFFFEDFHLSKQFHFVQNFFEYKIKFITRKFFFLRRGNKFLLMPMGASTVIIVMFGTPLNNHTKYLRIMEKDFVFLIVRFNKTEILLENLRNKTDL